MRFLAVLTNHDPEKLSVMGFWHSWEMTQTLEESRWRDIEADVSRLVDAVPHAVEERVERIKRRGGWFNQLAARAWAMTHRQAIRPGLAGGQFFGTNERGVRTMAFLPEADDLAAARLACINNVSGQQHAKTGAHFYDRVIVGALCLIHEAAPGQLRITKSDGEQDYWAYCAGWAGQVLGRQLTLPPGLDRLSDDDDELDSASSNNGKPPAP